MRDGRDGSPVERANLKSGPDVPNRGAILLKKHGPGTVSSDISSILFFFFVKRQGETLPRALKNK